MCGTMGTHIHIHADTRVLMHTRAHTHTGITITVLSNAETPGGAMTFRVDFANCSDGIQNQDETGVDCGGVCDNTCTCANQAKWVGLTCASPLFLNQSRECAGVACTATVCCISTTCDAQATASPGSIECAANSNLDISAGKTCTPGSTCTSAYCCESVCSLYGEGYACNDGDSFTVDDVCTVGVCKGTIATSTCGTTVTSCQTGYYVDAGAACTLGSSGNCTQALCCIPQCNANTVGRSCDDLDDSTVFDQCVQTVSYSTLGAPTTTTTAYNCVGTPASCGNQQGIAFSGCETPLILASGRLCTPGIAGNCSVSACCATFCELAGDGAACDDVNAGTVEDTCHAGLCIGMVPTCGNQEQSFGGCHGDDLLADLV